MMDAILSKTTKANKVLEAFDKGILVADTYVALVKVKDDES